MKTVLLAFAAVLICTPILSADASDVKIPSHGKALAVYAPRPQVPSEARLKRLRGSGVVVFHLRGEGTVSRVEVLQSTGHAVLDQACVQAFSFGVGIAPAPQARSNGRLSGLASRHSDRIPARASDETPW